MVVDNRVPAFCSVCGSRLQPEEATTGYDPYTGEPNKEFSLHCNNPTVTQSKRLGVVSTVTTSHPSWFVENGNWVQS